jgi:glucosamine 6-phosphate synthetase-like amidotransferase/phosphosugar isomerase protein
MLTARIKNLIELRRQMQLKIQRRKMLLPDEISVSSIDEAFLKELQEIVDHVIHIPATISPILPVLSTIPLQLLAYHAAIIRGCDVDQPRNLAKSVTVE